MWIRSNTLSSRIYNTTSNILSVCLKRQILIFFVLILMLWMLAMFQFTVFHNHDKPSVTNDNLDISRRDDDIIVVGKPSKHEDIHMGNPVKALITPKNNIIKDKSDTTSSVNQQKK